MHGILLMIGLLAIVIFYFSPFDLHMDEEEEDL